VLSVPGKYRYFCAPQEGIGMTGTITLRSRCCRTTAYN
jgi:plastocyanin